LFGGYWKGSSEGISTSIVKFVFGAFVNMIAPIS
jgi:hypothetical protein